MGPAAVMQGWTGCAAALITLRWAIVALIALQLMVNAGVQQGFADLMNGSCSPNGWAVLHIAPGLAVLGLAALRLGLRLTRGAPPTPPDNSAMVASAGMLANLALDLLMFAVPLAGAIARFGPGGIAVGLHALGRFLLTVLIGLDARGRRPGISSFARTPY